MESSEYYYEDCKYLHIRDDGGTDVVSDSGL